MNHSVSELMNTFSGNEKDVFGKGKDTSNVICWIEYKSWISEQLLLILLCT
jgi:hypothetical protein